MRRTILTYKYPIQLTQQFRFCGNAFRVDMYRGCDFGCSYCFANNRQGGVAKGFDSAEIDQLEKIFVKAFDKTDIEYRDVIIELVRHRVPMHLGGMSDPFQRREEKEKLTHQLLQLSNKYYYPIIMSTKVAHLSEEYWKILNPEIHAFQISIMGYDNDFMARYEHNTPSAQERINFIKQLRDRGFWVSLRLQPLIDLNQAKKLIISLDESANYITVEHLKIPQDNKAIMNLFEPIDKSIYYRPSSLRNLELLKEIKEKNILELKSLTKIKVGCGDNDLHYLSDSSNCCGIDTIGREFDNWLKYQYTYFVTNRDCNKDELWCPKYSVRSFLNPDTRRKGLNTYKDYTDLYCQKFSAKMNKNNKT